MQAGGQVGRGCLGSNKKNRDVISYQDAQKIVELDSLYIYILNIYAKHQLVVSFICVFGISILYLYVHIFEQLRM